MIEIILPNKKHGLTVKISVKMASFDFEKDHSCYITCQETLLDDEGVIVKQENKLVTLTNTNVIYYSPGDIMVPAVMYSEGEIIEPAIKYAKGDELPDGSKANGSEIKSPAIIGTGGEVKVTAVRSVTGREIKEEAKTDYTDFIKGFEKELKKALTSQLNSL